ncbi:MAG: hypothetical protein VX000_17130, partial [Myxococcota bacterium]|nr:hypothetical protein [Myxococcota bacterium]
LESHAGAVVDVHADPPAPSQLAWWADVPWRMLRRFLASSLGGYAAGRIDAPWEAVAPVVFGLLACAAAVRSRGRMAAVLLGSSLLLIVAIGLAFRGIADRTLPHEPRVFLTLLPALGCVWVAALQRLPRPLALSGAVLLTLSVGLPLAAQVATRSTMHRDAAALAAGAGPWLADAGLPLRELHVVVPDHRIHARLPHVIAPMGPGVRARQHRCIPDDASVIVLVRNEPLDVPATRPSCSGTRQPLAGHRLAAATSLGPPAHERNAASFLMPVQVEVWWPGLLPEGLPLARTLRLESALLDGIGPATEVGIRTGPAGGGGPERTVGSGPLGEGLDPVPISVLDEQVRLVFSPSAADLPETGLLDPLRREIQSTEAVLAAPLSLGDAPLRLAPFREPRLRVLLRLARIGLAVLAFLAVLWPGRRP